MTSVHRIQLIGVLAVYFLVGEVSEHLSTASSGISAFWPPAGVALAAMLLFGPRMLVAIALGAVAGSLVDISDGPIVTFAPLTGSTILNVLIDVVLAIAESFLAWYPLVKIGAVPDPFGRLRNAIIFIGVSAGIVPAVISALGSVAFVMVGQIGWSGFVESWLTWATGDSVGILVITPFVIAWMGSDHSQLNKAWFIEMTLATALVIAMGAAVILGYEIAQLLVLPLIWASLRLGMRGTSILVLIITSAALYVGFGDTMLASEEFRFDQSLIPTIAFVGGSTLLPLVLIPALLERRWASDHKAKLDRDLQIAKTIQQSLLPDAAPKCSGFDIAGWSLPADETGGDYYDWIFGSDGRLLVTLGDVSGHGIGPALVTTASRAYVRAAAQSNPPLGELLTWINNLLAADLPDGRFITLAAASVEPDSSRVLLRSAGHGPLFIYRASTKSVEVRDADDVPLGVIKGYEFGEAVNLDLGAGDMLIMLTDGFMEWANPAGELFGTARVCDSIVKAAGIAGSIGSAAGIAGSFGAAGIAGSIGAGDGGGNGAGNGAASMIASLVADVRTFVQGTIQLDDLTAVIIQQQSPA